MSKLNVLMLALACCCLSSCIIKPKKVVAYDAKCKIETKRYELTAEQVKLFENMRCENDDCRRQFASEVMGAVLLVRYSVRLYCCYRKYPALA